MDWLKVGVVVMILYGVVLALYLIREWRKPACPACYRPVERCSCYEDNIY